MHTVIDKISKSDQQSAFNSVERIKTRGYSKKLKKNTIKLNIEGIKEPLNIPIKVYFLLEQILESMSEGKAFTLISNDSELTTQQAAEILNISRPYLVRLLNKNEIPFRMVGTHRRLLLKDVLKYDSKRRKHRRNLINELTKEAQELNLGY